MDANKPTLWRKYRLTFISAAVVALGTWAGSKLVPGVFQGLLLACGIQTNEIVSPSRDSSPVAVPPGAYPQVSTRILTTEDLLTMSKEDLRIMRNEVFARYGYIFKTDDLRDHFSKQPWYQPRHSDVGKLLTDLEKMNVKLIKQYEDAQ